MNKEAIVVLLDVNSTMAKKLGQSKDNQNQPEEERIKVAKDAIRMLLEQKLLHNAKHDVGLVLFGTEGTDNRLQDVFKEDDQYTNVTTARELQNVDLDFFRFVQNIQTTPAAVSAPQGDMIDALVVGIDMLTRFVGTKKYKKRIFLVTDGEKKANIKNEQLNTIIETINAHGVKLNCITMDFCNELEESEDEDDNVDLNQKDNQIKDTGETPTQVQNKETLLKI